jgi:hypothetical protein
MKKTLRTTMLFAMAMFCGTTFAQEVTFDFTDQETWNFPADYATTEATYTDGTYSFKVNAPAPGHKVRTTKSGESMGLIYGKNGSTITFPKFDFAVERIDIMGNSDASGKVVTTFYVGEEEASNTCTGAKAEDGNTYIIKDAFQKAGTQLVLKTTSDDNNQISSIKIYKKGDAPVIELAEAENIAAFMALVPGTKATLTLTDAQVVYRWDTNKGHSQTFVRDASGAIQFYDEGLDLKVNQIVNGTVDLTFDIYQGTPEAKEAPTTNADNLTITDGEEAQPVEISTSDVADYVNDLVAIEGELEEIDGSYFIDDVQIYNKFHVDAYEVEKDEETGEIINNPLDKYVGGEGKIIGIVSAFTKTVDENTVTTYEIAIIDVQIEAVNAISSIEAKKENKNAAMYNAAGQRVNKNFKGMVIMNGKKFMNK